MFKSSKSGPTGTDTLIGKGTEIEGKVKCSTNLRVEGTINGDIECSHDITIGESSVCRSNITAKNIIIAGKVYGDLKIQEKLTIMPAGQLQGNFVSQSLVIQEGGVFNGSSNMNSKEGHSHKKDNETKEKKSS